MANSNNKDSNMLSTIVNNPLLLIGGGVLVYYAGKNLLESIKNKLGGLSDKNNNAGITMEAWNVNYWRSIPGCLIVTQSATDSIIKQLWSYQGVMKDDFVSVMSALKRLSTQTQVSYIAYKFNEKYKVDLYTYLKEGYRPLFAWFGDGLSNDHLTEVNDYVNKLPKCKK